MLKNLGILLVLSFIATGCAFYGDNYAYKPLSEDEKPATIEYGTGIGLEHKYNFILDDKIIRYDNGVVIQWIDDRYVSPLLSKNSAKDNLITLSPKPTKFTFLANSGKAKGTFEYELDVKPNEAYTLHMQAGSFAIKDKKKNVVKEFNYEIRQHYVPITVTIPR